MRRRIAEDLSPAMLTEGVYTAHTCHLFVRDCAWSFAHEHDAAIQSHWQRRVAANPSFFNGRILIADDACLSDGVLSASMIEVDFAAFLYWRDQGRKAPPAFDTFGSGIVRTRDGAILLGQQSTGNLNAGMLYPPGGFIDPRDIDAQGNIDITRSIRREVAEEFGIGDWLPRPCGDFIVTIYGRQIAIARIFDLNWNADEAIERMRGFLASDADGELEDVVAVRTQADLNDLPLPAYARVLLTHVFQMTHP